MYKCYSVEWMGGGDSNAKRERGWGNKQAREKRGSERKKEQKTNTNPARAREKVVRCVYSFFLSDFSGR